MYFGRFYRSINPHFVIITVQKKKGRTRKKKRKSRRIRRKKNTHAQNERVEKYIYASNKKMRRTNPCAFTRETLNFSNSIYKCGSRPIRCRRSLQNEFVRNTSALSDGYSFFRNKHFPTCIKIWLLMVLSPQIISHDETPYYYDDTFFFFFVFLAVLFIGYENALLRSNNFWYRRKKIKILITFIQYMINERMKIMNNDFNYFDINRT